MSQRNVLRRWLAGLKEGQAFDLASTDAIKILPKVHDTGAFHFGDGTTDMDVKVFLGTSAKYVLFDVGNVLMQLEDVDLLLGDNDQLRFGDGSGGDVQMAWNGTYLRGSGASPVLGGPWINAPSPADPEYRSKCVVVEEDFISGAVATGNNWVSMDDGGTGTNAFQDLLGGVLGILTAAADNDYHGLRTATKLIQPVAGKPIWFEARFKLTEATTNESAWWFGLSDTVTTGGLQAHAAGPLATYDGILIWKDEGTMTIDFETSNQGTQNTTSNMGTFVTNTWTKVGFYCDGTATTSIVYPFIDVGAGWVAGTQQNLTLATLNPMYVIFGVKAGPTAAAETLMVDYIRCVQLR